MKLIYKKDFHWLQNKQKNIYVLHVLLFSYYTATKTPHYQSRDNQKSTTTSNKRNQLMHRILHLVTNINQH